MLFICHDEQFERGTDGIKEEARFLLSNVRCIYDGEL